MKAYGNNVTATAVYKEPVSGTPVLALYNGKKLADVKIYDAVENAKNITLDIETEKQFDCAKVLVWVNTDVIAPQTAEIIFER